MDTVNVVVPKDPEAVKAAAKRAAFLEEGRMFAFLSKLPGVETDTTQLDDGSRFVALIQNRLHEVAFARLSADGTYLENARAHVLADGVRDRLHRRSFVVGGRRSTSPVTDLPPVMAAVKEEPHRPRAKVDLSLAGSIFLAL